MTSISLLAGRTVEFFKHVSLGKWMVPSCFSKKVIAVSLLQSVAAQLTPLLMLNYAPFYRENWCFIFQQSIQHIRPVRLEFLLCPQLWNS